MRWKSHADRLAAEVTHPISRWRPAVGAVPRHLFVPRWWERDGPGSRLGLATWELRDSPADPDAWVRAAYADQPLITRVGALHADHATSDDRPTGLPTSSAIAPGVIVRMLRHARLTDDGDVLEVSAGTGYGAAVLCERSGYRQVTTIEADEYLTKAAGERLAGIGLHPRVTRGDPYGPLPGRFDRIASMVAVRPVPANWLTALHPGGRLVTPDRRDRAHPHRGQDARRRRDRAHRNGTGALSCPPRSMPTARPSSPGCWPPCARPTARTSPPAGIPW